MSPQPVALPDTVDRVLADFVDTTRTALGPDLRSIVLYGSAAEGQLRKTSDVNVIVVLTAFDPARVDLLREPLRTAYAAIKLEAMFLLESEVPAAVEAFAVKFADILHRRRVLHGDDPFASIAPSRRAEITRLKQELLNLALRLRQKYLLRSLREEQAALVVAETAGPIRTCAEAILDLQGKPAPSPKEALARVAASLPGSGWDVVLGHISEARENRALPPGVAGPTILRLAELAQAMRSQVEALPEEAP
jgi:predicted nucleotidyltransferase